MGLQPQFKDGTMKNLQSSLSVKSVLISTTVQKLDSPSNVGGSLSHHEHLASIQATVRGFDVTMTMTMTMTHSGKVIQQLSKTWPYGLEC